MNQTKSIIKKIAIIATLSLALITFSNCDKDKVDAETDAETDTQEESDNGQVHDVPVLNEIQTMTNKPKQVEMQIDEINKKADALRAAEMKELEGM